MICCTPLAIGKSKKIVSVCPQFTLRIFLKQEMWFPVYSRLPFKCPFPVRHGKLQTKTKRWHKITFIILDVYPNLAGEKISCPRRV
jgi:hypothetical protein